LHGGGAADVVAALEPLAVERHRQRESLGANLVNLDGGGSGLHGVEPAAPSLRSRAPEPSPLLAMKITLPSSFFMQRVATRQKRKSPGEPGLNR
jgi:hypothetical protein